MSSALKICEVCGQPAYTRVPLLTVTEVISLGPLLDERGKYFPFDLETYRRPGVVHVIHQNAECWGKLRDQASRTARGPLRQERTQRQSARLHLC